MSMKGNSDKKNLLMNLGILSIKIPLNRARRSHYLDSRCTLTVMVPEMMPWTICYKKIILNKQKWIIACFLALNHESQ